MRPMNPHAGHRAGVLGIAITVAAGVSAAAFADTPGTQIPMKIADRSLKAGQDVRATGAPGRELAGRTVALEYLAGQSGWQPLATATIAGSGRYRVAGELPRSARVRVVLQPQPGTATASAQSSREARVAVSPRVRIGHRRLHVQAGRRATVNGRLKPAAGGARVSLQVRRPGGWRTIERDRTSSEGRFKLRDRRRQTLSAKARVVARPHAGLAKGRRKVGRLNVYRYAQASWYGPGFYGRQTGCGGRLDPGELGVAHKSLPCGSKVTFRHKGRSVRVRVIDRGPYVGGREYDLTEATARRLGFSGHGPVLTTR